MVTDRLQLLSGPGGGYEVKGHLALGNGLVSQMLEGEPIMLEVEDRFMIKDLHRKGISISDIARQTGHDRKTVRRALDEPLVPPSQPGQSVRYRLGPHVEYLNKRIDEGVLNASKPYDEIKQQGYEGSRGQLRAFVHSFRTMMTATCHYQPNRTFTDGRMLTIPVTVPHPDAAVQPARTLPAPPPTPSSQELPAGNTAYLLDALGSCFWHVLPYGTPWMAANQYTVASIQPNVNQPKQCTTPRFSTSTRTAAPFGGCKARATPCGRSTHGVWPAM